MPLLVRCDSLATTLAQTENASVAHEKMAQRFASYSVGCTVKVLVACEFSGIVRDAFKERGHDAWSCDLLMSERPGGQHLEGDVRWWLTPKMIKLWRWDLMIAHPPCTYLASSGARWFAERQQEQEDALDFVCTLLNADIERIAVENPVGVISTRVCKPTQIVQPYWFGHGETKATCWWLKNLPPLEPTNMVDGRTPRVHFASPGPERWKIRSRTLEGMARAMAEQWS